MHYLEIEEKIKTLNKILLIKLSGTTPRTPKGDKKGLKTRGPVNSDDEIEENISYVEESSKVNTQHFAKRIVSFNLYNFTIKDRRSNN
jgi:hypothetical protein